MKRTSEEIAAEIAALTEAKSFAPRFSKFDDDNHAQIDVQIEFLRGDLDTTAEEFDELPSGLQDAVMEAEQWRGSDSDEPPSRGWDAFRPRP